MYAGSVGPPKNRAAGCCLTPTQTCVTGFLAAPGGSPLKACLYLSFFFLHIPPSFMKCESSGAWTSWTTHSCLPLLIPASRELWSFPSLCISTLHPVLRPEPPGRPILCPSLGGSLATGVHLSDPLIGTGLSLSICNVGGLGLIPGLGRSPGEGNGYPLQYSGLEKVHGASKRWTGLSDFHSLSLHLRGRGSPAFLGVPIPLQI